MTSPTSGDDGATPHLPSGNVGDLCGVNTTRVLALDVDGVLLDPHRAGRGHWSIDLHARHGITPADLQRSFFDKHWHTVVTGRRPLEDALAEALSDLGVALDVSQVMNCWFESDFVLVEHAVAVAQLATTAGVSIVLATNQEHGRARYLAERFASLFPIDCVLYSADLGVQKDHAEFFHRGRRRLAASVQANELLLVDDTQSNVESAREAGWSALLADANAEWVNDLAHWIGRPLPTATGPSADSLSGSAQ